MATVAEMKRACRILIVEDDEDDVFLLKQAFNQMRNEFDCDIECEHSPNGLEALFELSVKDLTEALPDALVLDLNMPRVDGIACLQAIRQSLLLRDLPVFVLTTTASRSIHEQAIAVGANKVYVKPNDAAHLAAIAREIAVSSCSRHSRP